MLLSYIGFHERETQRQKVLCWKFTEDILESNIHKRVKEAPQSLSVK